MPFNKSRLTLGVRVKGAADWTMLEIPVYPNGAFVSSGNIDLGEYAGKSIQLGFKYTGDGSDSQYWCIKNVNVCVQKQGGEEPVPGEQVVLVDETFGTPVKVGGKWPLTQSYTGWTDIHGVTLGAMYGGGMDKSEIYAWESDLSNGILHFSKEGGDVQGFCVKDIDSKGYEKVTLTMKVAVDDVAAVGGNTKIAARPVVDGEDQRSIWIELPEFSAAHEWKEVEVQINPVGFERLDIYVGGANPGINIDDFKIVAE